MDSPKISTITSCYRAEKYLPLFLEQLPQQTMFDSLQVVLDHSEPTEREIRLVEDFLAQYPGKIKHIVREKVVPIYTAWNNCVHEADGEYLAIWNMDDLRTPDSLERQYEALQDPEVGVVYGDYYVVRHFGACEGDFQDRSGIPPCRHTRTMSTGPFFMFRKSLCAKAGYFDEQFKSSADLDFCIRLAFHTKFQHVPVNLGYYLNEGLGTSTRPDSPQPVEDLAIKLRYGIYDELDLNLLPRASVYAVPLLLHKGEWLDVSAFIPDWKALLDERGQALLGHGVKRNFKRAFGAIVAQDIRGTLRTVLSENAYSFLRKMWRVVRPKRK